MSGRTSTYAVMRAYINSPYHQVLECGAELVYSGESRLVGGYLSSSNEMVVELSDLQPNTEYAVVPFILYRSNGADRMAYGQSVSFRTPDRNGHPGTTPGIDDNTPPSPN